MAVRGAGPMAACWAVLAALCMVIGAEGAWVPLAPEAEQGEPTLAVKEMDREGMDVAISIPGIERDEVEIGGEVYQQFTIPGGIETDEVGYPSLPAITRLVAVPGQGGAEVRVTSIDSLVFEGVEIPPVAPWAIDGCAAEDPYWDPEVYGRDAFYPPSAAALGEPVIMRDLRLAQLVIYPVRYNPVRRELRVYQNVEVEIVFTDEGTNEKGMMRRRPSASFEELYRSLVLNYDELGRRSDGIERGSYLIITHDQFIEEIAPLAEWKQRKGWDVVVTPLSVIGSSPSATDIKNYISDAYFTWEIPPEYVLLVGDQWMGSIGEFPTFYYSNYCSDLPFTLLEGDDYFPETLISRISVDSESEANVVVAKTLGYERDPYMGSTHWYRRGLVVATTFVAASCKTTKLYVLHKMLDNGFTEVDSIWHPPELSSAPIKASINEGVSYVNYRGWGGASGWSYPAFYVSDIAALTNGWKQPVMTSLVCGTGNFAGSTDPCLGEAWIRYGTTSNPKGGPAFFGPSPVWTYTRWNNCIDSGIYWGVFDEKLTAFAQSMFRGKIELYNNFPNNVSPGGEVEFYFHVYNALGDPELNMWTWVPMEMTADHAASIPLGTNYLVVDVEVEGLPGEGALVCLYKEGEVFAREYADETGSVALSIDPGTTGDLLVTATKRNGEPYLGSVSIDQTSRFVGYDSHSIDDDNQGGSQGNGNGHVNPGETIEMPVVVRNWGTQSASSVTGYLTSNDPWVAIIDGEESFGTIGPGSTAQSLEDFDFQVSAACTNGHVLRFRLRANIGEEDYYTLIDVPVRGPHVVYYDHSIIDGGAVAGNGILDPGETADLVVTLYNGGLAPVTGVEATLLANDLWLTIYEAVGTFGTIAAGGTATNALSPFVLRADPLLRDGYDGHFILEITGDGGYEASVPFVIDVGTTGTTDPIGPDEYGYYAYDNTDTGYDEAPVYSWIEIDPNYGGSGTWVSLTGNDVDTLALPFTFGYYGQEYETISVCSNGFAALGQTWVSIWRNWGIPAAFGPDAMLAAFWDSLSTSGGGVYTYYEADQHRFIVEWSRCHNGHGWQEETFEIVLYDPVYHQTATGDGEIVFQYKVVSNVDYDENYATVGIEEPDQWYGLEYTYANHYPPEAASLAAGRAIKFTTDPPHLPAIGLELDPDAAVYHRGETLGYTAYVTNNTSYSQSVVGRADVTLPNGNPYPGNPVIGPKSVTLSSGQSAHPHFTHFIPQAAPFGTYTYTVTIEDGQGLVVAEDSFLFAVVP